MQARCLELQELLFWFFSNCYLLWFFFLSLKFILCSTEISCGLLVYSETRNARTRNTRNTCNESSVSQKMILTSSQIFMWCFLFCAMTTLCVAYFRAEALCTCQSCIIWKILNSPVFHSHFCFSPFLLNAKKYMFWLDVILPMLSNNIMLGAESVRSPTVQLSFFLLLYFFINVPNHWPNQLSTSIVCSSEPPLSLRSLQRPFITIQFTDLFFLKYFSNQVIQGIWWICVFIHDKRGRQPNINSLLNNDCTLFL